MSSATPSPIECVERGGLLSTSATAYIAGLSFDMAEREIACVRKAFDWSDRSFAFRELPEEQGLGNFLLLEAEYEHVTEVVSGFSQLGLPAEKLAKRAVGRIRGYLGSRAFAGPHLADQLLLPFALASGGAFTTVKPSQHSLTAAAVIGRFCDRRCVFTQLPGGSHREVR